MKRDTKDLFELVNEKLNDWEAQKDGGIPEPDVPEEVRSFLGNLGMLNGIPIYYLIPDVRYLAMRTAKINGHDIEQGAFKFFWLDKEWIECLMDGALSIGNDDERSLILTKAMSGNYVAEVYLRNKTDRLKKQLSNAYTPEEFETEFDKRRQRYLNNGKPEPTRAQNNWCYTGFLMRSELISAWPGIEVLAKGKDPNDTKIPDNPERVLQLVRMERIAADTLFCICEGIISQVEIKQPHEVLHFGLTMSNKDVTDPERSAGVIDISKLSKDLKVTDSASFAQNMMTQPYRFIIKITWEENKI
jgi:hypothetical protein